MTGNTYAGCFDSFCRGEGQGYYVISLSQSSNCVVGNNGHGGECGISCIDSKGSQRKVVAGHTTIGGHPERAVIAGVGPVRQGIEVYSIVIHSRGNIVKTAAAAASSVADRSRQRRKEGVTGGVDIGWIGCDGQCCDNTDPCAPEDEGGPCG